ncbi:helicase POLQ-like [Orussus abietinus]|uniref:helicase POLQ-like n=1 Tax=Orussus abietinus TaxID=222816 RepID=UPI000626C561|nr:helicase POLQ-like [Orussus abietinus]XP_012280091.1 helicase POLQ-like [Orussus abietinus]XP_012280093.1 helicase POLQ-like [Orussus abietinus]
MEEAEENIRDISLKNKRNRNITENSAGWHNDTLFNEAIMEFDLFDNEDCKLEGNTEVKGHDYCFKKPIEGATATLTHVDFVNNDVKNTYDLNLQVSLNHSSLKVCTNTLKESTKKEVLSNLSENEIPIIEDLAVYKLSHSTPKIYETNSVNSVHATLPNTLKHKSLTEEGNHSLKRKFLTDSFNLSIPNFLERSFDIPTPCSLNNSTDEQKTFYGLPSRIKTLIQKVKGISELYQWQDECLNLQAVKSRKNLIYALPTSGGKTLVAEMLMLREIVCNRKNVLFVLPFVALVQEKVRSMSPFALELGFLVEEYAAGKGIYPPRKRRRKNSIYICTIEKALGLVNSLIEQNRLKEIGIVVVDELHLLGEDGGRGAKLETLLTKVIFTDENVHVIGMSATIGNLQDLAKFLNAEIYTQNFRPIEIKEYVKCESDIWLLNLKEEEIFTDRKTVNYQYSKAATKIDPDMIGGLVKDVIPADSCLIFCSNRKNCENVSLLLTRILPKFIEEHKKEEKIKLLNSLRLLTENTICPVLNKSIRFGIAYHHSGLMAEERILLEDAFRGGTICVICCTSTLAAGVNLPARRVILRTPYVGNQFLTLSRYKQMIGRAGRAGLGEIGESILICKPQEISKVRALLTSKMDDSLSTLHKEEDRGIYNLILSSVLLSLATTRSELHKLMSKTLLSVQEGTLGVNTKKVTDKAIAELVKTGVLCVNQQQGKGTLVDSNVTVVFPTQVPTDSPQAVSPQNSKSIILKSSTVLDVSYLGKAAMKGSIDLSTAYVLYEDLKTAQKHLVLLDSLHLLYLITPYELASQITPVGSVYYDVVTNLSQIQMETSRLLGLDEAVITKIRDGILSKGIDPRVVQRFYLTLMLHELWNQESVYVVADKYQVHRGTIQNLLNATSSFAYSVVRFCEELEEFWAFRDLLTTFSKKLSCCCSSELESLMELPSVKVGRARQLYNAGYKTLKSIAQADGKELYTKIEHLPKKTAAQIIAAANLLLLEKVESLRDEAEEVLEGLDIFHA